MGEESRKEKRAASGRCVGRRSSRDGRRPEIPGGGEGGSPLSLTHQSLFALCAFVPMQPPSPTVPKLYYY